LSIDAEKGVGQGDVADIAVDLGFDDKSQRHFARLARSQRLL
jgi:hypothetical protein